MTTTNLVGVIEPYVVGNSFTEYAERFEEFFEFNQIDDNRKRSTFCTLSGPAIYSEIKLLFPGKRVKELSYTEIIQKLKSRYDKIDSDVIQCFKFNTRMQRSDETTESFILDLKLQASLCDFGTYKDKAIRDRILVGVYDKNLQKQLLKEEKLTLTDAERIITNYELANTRAAAINSEGQQVASVRERLGRRAAYDNNRNNGYYNRRDRTRSRSASFQRRVT